MILKNKIVIVSHNYEIKKAKVYLVISTSYAINMISNQVTVDLNVSTFNQKFKTFHGIIFFGWYS